MRILRGLAIVLLVVIVAVSALVDDPIGSGPRTISGVLLFLVGAMLAAGHAVPLRLNGLAAGALALVTGLAVVLLARAAPGLVVGLAALAGQAGLLVTSRRSRRRLAAHPGVAT